MSHIIREIASTPRPIIEVELDDDQVRLVTAHAWMAKVGGRSVIRGDARKETLHIDQQVGQIGTLGYLLYKYGDDGRKIYDEMRRKQNMNPRKGDGGNDVPGERTDVKASLWRHRTRSLWTHNLCVRPHERHKDWRYVMAMVPESLAKVWLLGWRSDESLPPTTVESGPLAGTFAVVASDTWELPVPAAQAAVPQGWYDGPTAEEQAIFNQWFAETGDVFGSRAVRPGSRR